MGRPTGAVPVTDREQLLDAAERSIARLGPSASMEAIATEAAVTKPVLYQYVGNKEALVEALAERQMVRINTAIDRNTRGLAQGPARVRGFLAAFFDVVAANPALYQFLTAAWANETSPQRSLTFADQSALPLATVLARQRTMMGADPAVATTWAYGIVGMLHYVTLWWLREPVLTLDGIVDHVTELLWPGLVSPGPAVAPSHPAHEGDRS